MRGKLLTLHHELLYPAFLGAALFEFTRHVTEQGIADYLWLFSAFWFLSYFSVAFLALADAAQIDHGDHFGIIAFFSNLIEIGVILAINFFIETTDGSVTHLNYNLIYAAWIAIPITGGISNLFSGRQVHLGLSCVAFAIAAFGYFTVHNSTDRYLSVLLSMYMLLVMYFCAVAGRPLPNLFNWTFGPWVYRAQPAP